jgi:YjbE family integral membrane protein
VNLAEVLSAEFWVRWVQIVILDLTLAGDNALVIALAVRKLPPRQQWQGRIWGTLGAVGLRVLFIAVISVLLRVPLLQALGGVLLLWIALKLLSQEGHGGEAEEGHAVRAGTTLYEAIWIIIVADVVMSLDNVLAISGAAHGDMVLVIFGVGLSIPIVIWGSGLLARLMARFWWIVDLGAAILGWVAGEMILKDAVVRGWLGGHDGPAVHRTVQAVLALGVVAVGRLWVRRKQRASPVRGRAVEE